MPDIHGEVRKFEIWNRRFYRVGGIDILAGSSEFFVHNYNDLLAYLGEDIFFRSKLQNTLYRFTEDVELIVPNSLPYHAMWARILPAYMTADGVRHSFMVGGYPAGGSIGDYGIIYEDNLGQFPGGDCPRMLFYGNAASGSATVDTTVVMWTSGAVWTMPEVYFRMRQTDEEIVANKILALGMAQGWHK